MAKPRKSKGPTETQLQSECLDKLASAGFMAHRCNSGMAKGFFGGVIHLHPKGTFDLLLLHPYAWIEVKRPGEQLKPEQLAFQDWLEDHSIPHTIVNSGDEAVAFARSLTP